MRFGFHISIASGFAKITERALKKKCQTIQFFSRNPRGWEYKKIDLQEAALFRKSLLRTDLRPVFVHMPYLPNLASPDPDLLQRSVHSLCEDLRRAEQLGAEYLIVHVGHRGESSEEESLERISKAVNHAFDAVPNSVKLLLENTAGQGTQMGFRFVQLQKILAGIYHTQRAGICLDTAHAFEAGYDVSTKTGLEKTVDEFEKHIGLGRLHLLHLNDSKTPLGSHADRHWHIGKGYIGRDGFRRIINHPAFRTIPGIMETPRTSDRDDLRNMKVVKSLVIEKQRA